MKDGPDIAPVAASIGDRARADVLTALMADRALTATELSDIAGVTRQTISAHLAKSLPARPCWQERRSSDPAIPCD